MGLWSALAGIFKFTGHYLNFSFFIIFIGILIFGASIDSYNVKSLEPMINILGDRFFNTVSNLNEGSLIIIEQGGAIIKGNNFLETIFLTIKTYWDFFLNLYIIYLELWLLAWLIGHSPLSDTSNVFVNWFLGIAIFFTLQEFYILFKDMPMNLPLIAIKNFFKSITLLIEPAKNFAGNIIEKTEIINVGFENQTNGSSHL